MAIVKLNDGRTVTLGREKAHEIWAVLNGEKEGTEEQRKFCDTVSKVYLNRHHAPKSYLDAHRTLFEQMT